MAWSFRATRACRIRSPTSQRELLSPAWNGLFARYSSGWLAKLTGGPGNTSIRAGYGMFYTAFEGLSAGIMSANPPFGSTYTSSGPPLVTNPFVTASSGQNYGQPFPLPMFLSAPVRPIPMRTSIGRAMNRSTAFPLSRRTIKFLTRRTTCFSFQRKFGAATVASASYVGTQAHHLLALVEANPGNPALCLALSNPADLAPGTAPCGPFGENGTYTTASGQVIHGARRPFPSAFASVGYQKTMANSNYNALAAQSSAQQRRART